MMSYFTVIFLFTVSQFIINGYAAIQNTWQFVPLIFQNEDINEHRSFSLLENPFDAFNDQPEIMTEVGCSCQDKLNKDITLALKSCGKALKSIAECEAPCNVSMQVLNRWYHPRIACKSCGKEVTKELINTLTLCFDALSDGIGCTGTGVTSPPPPAPPASPPATPAPPSAPNLPSSCKEIKAKNPRSTSKYYNILVNGKSKSVFCYMGKICGVAGGWAKIAQYAMHIPSTQVCPTDFKPTKVGNFKTCGRQDTNTSSCNSVTFPVGFKYNKICSRVHGYQRGRTTALKDGGNDLNEPYVDGVSITRGTPRKHVWTFMVGLYDNIKSADLNCPCSTGSTQKVPSFISNDYFCESGMHVKWLDKYYSHVFKADLLWDRRYCPAIERPCCKAKGIPWANKIITEGPTTDDIELRICGTGGTDKKDILVRHYAIYVH